jgi:hypothetical protein
MDRLLSISISGELEGDYVVLAERGNGSLLIAPVPAGGAPVVVAMKQTCSACPSQWEGELEDGRALYVRYRWGELSAGVGEDIGAAVKNGRAEETLFFEHVGDGLDGSMTFKELKGHLQGLLEFPNELVVEGERDWSTEKIDVKWLDELRGLSDSSGSTVDPSRQSDS